MKIPNNRRYLEEGIELWLEAWIIPSFWEENVEEASTKGMKEK